MAIYLYKAKRGPEELIEGKIEARDEKEAIEKISQLGYVATRLELFTPDVVKKTSEKKLLDFKIRPKEITIFSRQLATLLKSGVPILSSINIIQQQSENPHFRYILSQIHSSLKEGASFSLVLAKYTKLFSPLYISLIKTAEDSGTLPEVLLRIADYRRKQEEFLNKVKMALVYPLLMVIVGIGTVIFMLGFVLPKISQIFLGLNQQLPLPTRIILAISNFLKTKFLGLMILSLLLIFIFLRYIRTEKGKVDFDRFKLGLPFLGRFILKTELSRFSRTLELLIKNGISVIRAIELSIPVLDNEILKDCFVNSLKELHRGGSFGRSLKNYSVIPLFISNLIIIGEESGKLAEAFAEIADSYQQDTEETVKAFTTLLEPILILVIGVVIGFIVIAMLLPIFEMNLAIR